MKFPWTLVMLMLVTATAFASYPTTLSKESSTWNAHTEAQIKERLAQLDLPLTVVTNDQVINRIRQYITAGKNDTELILGRTVAYFPVFEDYLMKEGLPKEMKYLPMIESGLRPTVKSGVGAAGMWQLMPVTARYNGLTVNSQIDQRLDPYASTEGATKMLALLYRQFKDWGLVLAAYNCGPGRVKKAVQAAGSNDYWKVKQYLPKETQKYVPRFIAAAYIAQYYGSHGLEPRVTATTSLAQDTRVIKVNKTMKFSQIAQATGLSIHIIQKLNPSYIQSYIPASNNPLNLVLPSASTIAFRNYLEGRSTKVLAKDRQVSTIYVVSKGDELTKIAERFNTTEAAIREWNNLEEGKNIVINQELVLYLSRSYLMKRA